MVEHDITSLEGKIEEFNRKLEELKSLSVAQALATNLHDTLCKSNHTDGCAWHYYDWIEKSDVRDKWLNKAIQMLETMSYKEAMKILDIFK